MKESNSGTRGIEVRSAARCTHGGNRRERIARTLHVALLLLATGGAMQCAFAKKPDKTLLDMRVTQQSVADTICRPDYADTVSPSLDEVMAHKSQLLAARGIDPHVGSSYALDRYVPILLGGSPDAPENFDLLPWGGHDGERRKELLATRLKRCVCAGRMSLADAQATIVGNWTKQYARVARMSCDAESLDTGTAGRDDGS
ncbi:MAG TPA: hypothetical protein VGG24_16305 [Paraburkholderia sp.]|jgi:hypothetical protein